MINHNYIDLTQYPEVIGNWISDSIPLMDSRLDPQNNRDMNYWLSVLDKIPDNNVAVPTIENGYLCSHSNSTEPLLKDLLMEFRPWRKGPFNLQDVIVETEWRSDFKWNRLKPHLSGMKDAHILDIGCGNGYHCCRMALEGARTVTGIDSFALNVIQFHVLKKFFKLDNVSILPIGIEEIPLNMQVFDFVFSMGVLYHRRSPFDHLIHIKSLLKPGKRAIIETLVVEGSEGMALVPEDRYAKMRNVWFIPSQDTMIQWMKRCGYKNCKCVDITATTLAEQRPTEWMTFESLPDFLDKDDLSKTIEGYPAPARAIFIGEA